MTWFSLNTCAGRDLRVGQSLIYSFRLITSITVILCYFQDCSSYIVVLRDFVGQKDIKMTRFVVIYFGILCLLGKYKRFQTAVVLYKYLFFIHFFHSGFKKRAFITSKTTTTTISNNNHHHQRWRAPMQQQVTTTKIFVHFQNLKWLNFSEEIFVFRLNKTNCFSD